jgi:hypothetical protein
MEVAAVLRLFSQHLSPIGDILGVLLAPNDNGIAVKDDAGFDFAHAISVTEQKPVEVDVLLNAHICPGVTVKYSALPLATIFIEDDVAVAASVVPEVVPAPIASQP